MSKRRPAHQELIFRLWKTHGRRPVKETWREMEKRTGFNPGTLCAVANGKRKPTNAMLDYFSIKHSVSVKIMPCKYCGGIDDHRITVNRCPARPRPVRRPTHAQRRFALIHRDKWRSTYAYAVRVLLQGGNS